MILVEAAQHMIVSKHAPKEESLSVQHRQQMICGRYIFFFFLFLRLGQSLALQLVADESHRNYVEYCILFVAAADARATTEQRYQIFIGH